jgi:hypothetical protein
MVPLRIDFIANNNAVVRACLNAKTAAFASFFQYYNIAFGLLFGYFR